LRYVELARQHGPGLILVRKLTLNAAILAFLVPAETSIRDGFGRDILKASQQRILFGDLKGLSANRDFHQALVGPKNAAHPCPVLLSRSGRTGAWDKETVAYGLPPLKA
jgi:hypothetical protein